MAPERKVEPLLVDINQAAVMLGVSVSHIKRLRDAGQFPKPVRLGRAVRFRVADINRLAG